MSLARTVTAIAGGALPLALVAACGARSGLFPFGAGAGEDASADAAPSEDAPIFEDAFVPPLDANPPDVQLPKQCADAADTLIYTVTSDNSTGGATNFHLLKFDPSANRFTFIGNLVCPDEGQPFSMAVDRTGAAYVLYYNELLVGEGLVPPPGNIYRVDLTNAACTPTSWAPAQQFQSFGMAFVADDTGGGETLYIASNNNDQTSSGYLGAVDEATLTATYVGTFSPTVMQAELTGTGDGRLFAFWAPNTSTSPGSAVAQIDKATATVVGAVQLPQVTQGGGWAFAFWGGAFYLFTNPSGPTAGDTTTVVQKYDPATGDVTEVATYPDTVVGAGVSTCAPVK